MLRWPESSKRANDVRSGGCQKKLIQRRLIPACEPCFCWGLHGGREWVVVGSNEGHISILCNGAAGAASNKKTFSLWQTIRLKVNSPKGSSRSLGSPRNLGVEEEKKGCEEDGGDWRITALAWCKYPWNKIGEHPLDSDARYCASFAVGSFGRISIFNPSLKNKFEWELVSELHPAGKVLTLSWAPEGHHLVSGGDQVILWSPDSLHNVGNSMESARRESPTDGEPPSANSFSTEKNHQRLLMARSPMMASVISSTDDLNGLVDNCNEEIEKGDIFDASWVLDCKDGETVYLADFSADGRMFATVAKKSMEVRVWFEGESLYGNLDYLSLYHPKEVVSVRWRPRANASSLHAKPRGSHTPQSLITLSQDQKIRIWQESDPQTEELSFFVAVTIDTCHRIMSVGWLQFINFFEGLRSPFPEHNSYSLDREDFSVGFHSSSPFFQTSAHFASVWGQHQRQAAELRTGPIAQEARSSLDWIVAVDESGKVCMWSVEGLSDSPRRDVHCLAWSRSTNTIFKENMVTNQNTFVPFSTRRNEDICHPKYLKKRKSRIGGEFLFDDSTTRAMPITSPHHMDGEQEEKDYVPEPVEEDEQDDADRGQDGSIYGTPLRPVFVDLAATCRITQEFDPHVERDPWPSTSVFDINPRNIEVVSLSEFGLVYTHAEVNTESNDTAYGTVVHEDLCLVKAHTCEILRFSAESVVDMSRNYSPVEESYWVTSVDAKGLALAWPVRHGRSDEEVDADALIRKSSLPLPRQGSTLFACCSEIERGHLVAAIVSSYGSLELWERQDAFVGDFLARGGPPQWRRVQIIRRDVASTCQAMFVVRQANYVIVIGLLYNHGQTMALFLSEYKNGKVVVTQLADHSNLQATAVCAVSDKQLVKHGAFAIVACSNGFVKLLGGESGRSSVIGSFQFAQHFEDDPVINIANTGSGKILTAHRSNVVKIWQPGLCHLFYTLESIIDPSLDIGNCDVELVQGLYIGGGVDIIGVAVLHKIMDRVIGTSVVSKIPKVLLYSVSRSQASALPRAGTTFSNYKLLCTTENVLSGLYVRGIAWSGRDFGMAVASDVEIHLFQGWFRHTEGDEALKELQSLRKLSELSGVPVGATATMQVEAVNSIGDESLGLHLPLSFHRPQAILEMLRAGWVEPVRKILAKLLDTLAKRRDENAEMYEEDEKPPAKAMVVEPPNFSLQNILADAGIAEAIQSSNKALLNSSSHRDLLADDVENEVPQGEDNASSLFDDGWSFGNTSSSFSAFGSGTGRGSGGGASALFDEDPWDSVLGSMNKTPVTLSNISDLNFGSDGGKENSELPELLTTFHIKGLDSLEQLQLTAVAGVFDEVYGLQSDKDGFGSGVDERAKRFLLSYKIFRVSSRCLTPADRPRAMTTADAAWAADSDSQDILVSQCLPPGQSSWEDARKIGVGLWLRNPTVAKTLAEEIAKVQYQKSDRDPFACALFYFALGKANVVSGLFRLVKNTKAAEMLANDFTQEHWQTVATKNAFSLVKQQRWRDAASFFLLAGKLQEATNICVKNMRDYQLALFLCRIVEGETGPVQARLWEHTVKPLGVRASDRWLWSIVNSALGRHEQALLAFVHDKDSFLSAISAEGSVSPEITTEVETLFEDRATILGQSKISKEVLEQLEGESLPLLSVAFNTLEPFYIHCMQEDVRRLSSLARLKKLNVVKRVLHESMQRAASHFASAGIPLLSLFELESIDTGVCKSCSGLWRTRLSAQAFHPFLVEKHTCELPRVKKPLSSLQAEADSDTDDSVGPFEDSPDQCAERKENSSKGIMLGRRKNSMVRASKEIEDLGADLNTLVTVIGKCSKIEVLESLWKVSRASNQIAIELTVLRLLHAPKDGSFSVRLEQVMNSVMATFVSLGQSRIDAGSACESHLLSGRRLAAYSILFVDLVDGVDDLLKESCLDLSGVAEPNGREKLVKLLDSFARVALFCAAYLLEQLELIQALLSSDYPLGSVRKMASLLSSSWFDYEELLSWASRDSVGKQTQANLSMSSSQSSGIESSWNECDSEDADAEDEGDLRRWGIQYARKMMDVVCMRMMLRQLVQRRDEIVSLSDSRQGTSNLSIDPKTDRGEDFCVALIEDLLQSCWPLNWTLLSDLQNCHIPVGFSDVGSRRLVSMQDKAFPDQERNNFWKFLRGKEQLCILTATANWTERSLDRERVRTGCIPDPEVFCAKNAKVVYHQTGSLLLSVDSINALDGTIIAASEHGFEVVSYSFAGCDEDTVIDDDNRSDRSMADSGYFPDVEEVESISSLSSFRRDRKRSISENQLPHPDPRTVETDFQQNSASTYPSDEEMASGGSPIEKPHRKLLSHPSSLLPRPRRPHIQLKRLSSTRKGIRKQTTHKFSHSWSTLARSLLHVSKASDSLWWGEDIRMPLNGNLYGNSFVHNVSSHRRVKDLLRDGCAPKDWTDPLSPESPGELPSRPQSAGTSRRTLLARKKSPESGKAMMHLEAHPFLPIFAVAGWNGGSTLYDAESEAPIAHFKKPGAGTPWKSGHGTRVRFSEDGVRLAGCDSAGQLLLWSLDGCHNGEDDPFSSIQCHSKRALDCAFLNYNGSIVATVGQSTHSENLCLWDLSVPPRSSRVAKVVCSYHSAAYSVAHLQDEQVLLVGGGNGQLGVFDLRQRTLIMEEDGVHGKAIRSLAVHPSKGNFFGSGSTDGTVKLWTYRNGRPMSHAHLTGMHPTHTFMNVATSDSLISQRGTTDLAFSSDFLFTCGADGKVKMTPLSSLMV